MTDNNNNKPKSRSLLWEDGMSVRDYLLRRSFYQATCQPSSTLSSMQFEDPELYEQMIVPRTHEDFTRVDTYTTCSQELFEYSLRGVSSIKI